MKKLAPIPKDFELGTNLAQRVRQLRELRNLTAADVCKECRFSKERFDDIESGIETWLSTSDRQRLAKALAVEPGILEEVEVKLPMPGSDQSHTIDIEGLKATIFSGARELPCPSCGATLRCGIQDALDIEGNPVRLTKAACTKCLFIF